MLNEVVGADWEGKRRIFPCGTLINQFSARNECKRQRNGFWNRNQGDKKDRENIQHGLCPMLLSSIPFGFHGTLKKSNNSIFQNIEHVKGLTPFLQLVYLVHTLDIERWNH